MEIKGSLRAGATERKWLPNHQRWHAKWELSRNMYTSHTCFWTFGTDLNAKSVLTNKISASELGRNFIKVALLVGHNDFDPTLARNYNFSKTVPHCKGCLKMLRFLKMKFSSLFSSFPPTIISFPFSVCTRPIFVLPHLSLSLFLFPTFDAMTGRYFLL